MSQLDIYIVSIPKLELRAPLPSPAYLKSFIEQHGFTCKTYDYNVDLWWKMCNTHAELWEDHNIALFMKEKYDPLFESHLNQIIKGWIDEIIELNPRWFGLSIMSKSSSLIALDMVKELKSRNTDIKIVIGGPWLDGLTEEDDLIQLANCYVKKEGEYPLLEILRGNFNAPGINDIPPKQISDLNSLPPADFRDYDLSLYPDKFYDIMNPRNQDKSRAGCKCLYITSSRGCVRKCTFCDIISQWPQFVFQKGDVTAEEILIHYKRHNISTFHFTDSVVNGSRKALLDFCNTIIDYKATGKMPKEIRFKGQFNCKPKNQAPEDDFKIMKEAGYHHLAIGIESGSEQVRYHIGKKFSNDDIDYTFQMLKNNGMTCGALMMVGYPTETEEDFMESIKLFERNIDKKNSVILNVAIGPTMIIIPGAPITNMLDEMGIFYDDLGNWVYKDNTIIVRAKRWLRLKDRLEELGYKVGPERHSQLIEQFLKGEQW